MHQYRLRQFHMTIKNHMMLLVKMICYAGRAFRQASRPGLSILRKTTPKRRLHWHLYSSLKKQLLTYSTNSWISSWQSRCLSKRLRDDLPCGEWDDYCPFKYYWINVPHLLERIDNKYHVITHEIEISSCITRALLAVMILAV